MQRHRDRRRCWRHSLRCRRLVSPALGTLRQKLSCWSCNRLMGVWEALAAEQEAIAENR